MVIPYTHRMMYNRHALQTCSQRAQHLKRPQGIDSASTSVANNAGDTVGLDGPEVFGVGAGVNAGDDDADRASADVGEGVFGFEALGDGAGGG